MNSLNRKHPKLLRARILTLSPSAPAGWRHGRRHLGPGEADQASRQNPLSTTRRRKRNPAWPSNREIARAAQSHGRRLDTPFLKFPVCGGLCRCPPPHLFLSSFGDGGGGAQTRALSSKTNARGQDPTRQQEENMLRAADESRNCRELATF